MRTARFWLYRGYERYLTTYSTFTESWIRDGLGVLDSFTARGVVFMGYTTEFIWSTCVSCLVAIRMRSKLLEAIERCGRRCASVCLYRGLYTSSALCFVAGCLELAIGVGSLRVSLLAFRKGMTRRVYRVRLARRSSRVTKWDALNVFHG